MNNSTLKTVLILSLLICAQFLFAQSNYRQFSTKKTESGKNIFIQIDNLSLIQESNLGMEMSFLKYCFNHKDQDSFVILDTSIYSAYKSEIFAYKSPKFNDFILIWVTEYEFDSDIHLLYLKEKRIKKIGTLPVQNTCDDCDTKTYPIKKIKITGTETEIKFSFLQPVTVQDNDVNSIENNSKELYFIYDRKTEKLTKHRR